MRLVLPPNARVFTDANAAFSHLNKYHGIAPELASERLHRIKSKRAPAADVLFDRTGGVWDPATRENLGNLTEGGAKRIS